MKETKLEHMSVAEVVSPSTDTKPMWSFRLKLTLLAVLVACLPVAVVGWSIQSVNEKALQHANQELLFAVIEDASRVASAPIRFAEAELNAVAGALSNTNLSVDERIAVAKAVVSGAQDRAIGIYDQNLKRIDRVGKDGMERLPGALGAQKEVSKHVQFDESGAFILSRKKFKFEKENWTIATATPVDNLQNLLESAGVARLGAVHRLLAIDTNGKVIADSDQERVGSTATADDVGALAKYDYQALGKGILAFGEFKTKNGATHISAIKTVDGLPWAVVAEIPRNVAYASLAKMRRVILGVVLGAMILAGLIALLFARQLTRPINKLVNFAQKLADRRFESRVKIDSKDELGVLGTALSDAASELQASDKRIRKEMEIRGDLGRYLPEQLVNRIVDRSQNMSLGGERRRITVLFADVVGFTPLAENQKAEDVVTILNELFTVMTEVIFRHKGTVDKFVGDCIMAFWGAPNPQKNHSELALSAAEDMIQWLEVANEGWKERFGIEIELAIGVNTGEAVVGNFGSESRMEYTAIGDVVNVASRLESIARPNQILITQATKSASEDLFETRRVGERRMPGRSRPVEIFEVVA